jgi:hypothetical protein
MTDMTMIGWILVIIGIGLAIGLVASKKTFGVHPALLGIVIGALILGPFAMGWATFPAEDAPPSTPGTIIIDEGEVQYPTFDVDPAVSNTSAAAEVIVLNSDETGFTIPFRANTTQHDIYPQNATEDSTGASWFDPEVEFAITPIPFAGADADDLATIYYEVMEPNLEVDAATSGPYYAFVKTGANRQLEWHVAGSGETQYVDGSQTMLMTGNVTVQLYMELDEGSLSRIQNTFDGLTWHVRFYNNGGWSQTFTMTFICTNLGTANTPDVW